jgi:hypothetical protein
MNGVEQRASYIGVHPKEKTEITISLKSRGGIASTY